MDVKINRNYPGIIILIGPPGAGKTTYRKAFMEQAKKIPFDCYPISSDELRTYKKEHHLVWDNATLFAEIKEKMLYILTDGSWVILDATNCNKLHRSGMVKKIRKTVPNTQIIGVVFDSSLYDCLTQNHNRDVVVPDDVVIKMWENLRDNPPSISEGFDVIVNSNTSITYSLGLELCGSCYRPKHID